MHIRHNPDIPSYVAFVDLVKSFGTVNHKMMLQILEQYGAPPKLRSAISRIYKDIKIVLKIGKVENKMGQTVGVRQGDFMAPVLFLFMVKWRGVNLMDIGSKVFSSLINKILFKIIK